MATVKTRRTLAKAGVITGLVLGALFAGLPVLWMLSTSFKANGEVFQNPPKLITESFSFDAYREILGNGAQLRFFLNSYIVAIAVTVLTLLVAILAGYAFSRFTFPMQKTINAVIVSVQAVPPITLVIPYFGLVVALGLYNTYPGLILTHMVFTLPYAIIMTTAYLNTLPQGAGRVRQGRRRQQLDRALADPRADLGAGPDRGRRLHVHDLVERVPVRAHADPHRRHAHGADRHPAAHGPALVRVEPDDGDEHPRLHSRFSSSSWSSSGGSSAGSPPAPSRPDTAPS